MLFDREYDLRGWIRRDLAAFAALGLDWRRRVETDASLLNKISHPLCGDSGKLRATTGWAPTVSL
jgi:hypothetical protein